MEDATIYIFQYLINLDANIVYVSVKGKDYFTNNDKRCFLEYINHIEKSIESSIHNWLTSMIIEYDDNLI